MQPNWNTIFTDCPHPMVTDPALYAKISANTPCMVPLPNQGVVAVEGPDAQTFLQGQLSCDMTQITPTSSQMGIYATLQGRVFIDCRVIPRAEGYWLATHRNNLPALIQQLKRYGVFSNVNISEQESILVLGVQHPTEIANTVWPQTINEVSLSSPLIINVGPERYEIYANADEMKPYYTALLPTHNPVDAGLWTLRAIEDATVHIQPETQGLYFPHRLQYHRLGWLNFKKGCYLGQEIIARVHYKGSLKHQLVRVDIESSAPLTPGLRLSVTENLILEMPSVNAIGANRYCALVIAPEDWAVSDKGIVATVAEAANQTVTLFPAKVNDETDN